MNKEEKELIQKQVDKKYLETQEYGRNQFVCKIVELERYIDTLQSQLDIANNKLNKIKEKTEFDMKMWSKEDGFILINGNELLSIIGGE